MVMLCHVPQVIAASALVISEARGLLEMAEPAWDYAAYHSMWAITAGDCELEGRLKALEVKVCCCSAGTVYKLSICFTHAYHDIILLRFLLAVYECSVCFVNVCLAEVCARAWISREQGHWC